EPGQEGLVRADRGERGVGERGVGGVVVADHRHVVRYPALHVPEAGEHSQGQLVVAAHDAVHLRVLHGEDVGGTTPVGAMPVRDLGGGGGVRVAPVASEGLAEALHAQRGGAVRVGYGAVGQGADEGEPPPACGQQVRGGVGAGAHDVAAA